MLQKIKNILPSRKTICGVLKFAGSSFLAFLIDYFGFLLLNGWCGDVAANAIARVVSSAVNFYVNKKLVFNSNENTFKAALKYALLALAILAVDTLLLKGLFIETFHIPDWIAKPVTETTMFCLNFPIQRRFVYKKREDKALQDK